MKRFVLALAAFFIVSPACAVTCNDPSGFLKTFGPITLGNILILGPDCQHAQDGGGGASFTPDNPPQPGTAGNVPAPPVGTSEMNAILGINGWRSQKPLLPFVMPPTYATKAFPNRPEVAPSSNLGTSGVGSTTMSATPSDVFNSILSQQGLLVPDVSNVVDPQAGVDTGTGSGACLAANPCLTLGYVLRNGTHVNILVKATGPIEPGVLDGSVAAQLVHRVTFDGPITIRTAGPSIPAQTFTVTSGVVYQTTLTLSGSAAVQRFLYADTFDPGTGNFTRFPHYASLATLQAAANANPGTTFGWFFDPATKNLYVAFFGLNVNTYKTKMQAFYTGTNGDSAMLVDAGGVLFIDCVYQCTFNGVNFQAVNITSSQPTLLMEGRGLLRIFCAFSNGVHQQGGFVYASGVDVEASQYDNFNSDPSSNGLEGQLIVHNSRSFYAGDFATYNTDGSLQMNRNGMSVHGGVNSIYAGVTTGYNYGPNIADTTTAGFQSLSWIVGVETITSADGADAGIGCYGNAGDPVGTTRKCYVDTSATFKEAISIQGVNPSIQLYVFNNSFNTVHSLQLGASYAAYSRDAPP